MRTGVIDQAASRDLRRRVLRPGLGPNDPLPGDDLTTGLHVGAMDHDGTVLGTCYVYPDACPWRPDAANPWHLRQMATEPAAQGKGVGALVLAAAVDIVTDRGADLLWCNARETAVGFYAKYGFVVEGDVFIDERHPIPHLRMWLKIG